MDKLAQMMDSTGLQARPLSLAQKPFKLSTVLEGLSRVLEPDALRKGLAWRIDLPAPWGGMALVEQTHTEAVFRFEVCVTGIGMAPTDQGPIFNRFERHAGNSKRRLGGTGMGPVFWFSARQRKLEVTT